jgi:hypothetical protein
MSEQTGGMKPSERFVPVGGNIFNRETGQFIQPPTPAEVEQLKPSLEKGERWNAEAGRVEEVPGSKLYNARNKAHTETLTKVKGVEDKVGSGVKRVDDILSDKNKDAFEGNFGGYSAYASRLLSGPNSDMRVKLDQFKSDMASAGLELIRQGGSIGQMTEKEWPIVEGLIGRIDPVMSVPEARALFKEIRTRFSNIIQTANDLYDSEWADTQFYKEREGESKPDPLGIR